jgi:hypothetical protein
MPPRSPGLKSWQWMKLNASEQVATTREELEQLLA